MKRWQWRKVSEINRGDREKIKYFFLIRVLEYMLKATWQKEIIIKNPTLYLALLSLYSFTYCLGHPPPKKKCPMFGLWTKKKYQTPEARGEILKDFLVLTIKQKQKGSKWYGARSKISSLSQNFHYITHGDGDGDFPFQFLTFFFLKVYWLACKVGFSIRTWITSVIIYSFKCF